jgi:BirA family transcriptional regulator, biotin operon repressor / biotin---[acetyl-CoA-carboxylase] ligase
VTSEALRSLVATLADGRWHSGAAIGARLGLTRAAVWKQSQLLREMGVPLETRRGLGYRWPGAPELLSQQAIQAALSPAARAHLQPLKSELRLDSTSARLRAAPAPPAGGMQALLAEFQSGGRGRRGRRWWSPLGCGLCMSASWLWESTPRDFPALSLAVGIVVAEELTALGGHGIGVKWPNDLVASHRGGIGKLGGILVDVAGESGGPYHVVVGLGLNISHSPKLDPEEEGNAGALPTVSLSDLTMASLPSRNRLAAGILERLHRLMLDYPLSGFSAYLQRWQQYDRLAGQAVTISQGATISRGIARGVAGDGALLVDVDGRRTTVLAGDVTLRDCS